MMRIVTLTLNPCLDQITAVDRMEPDAKLRADRPRYEPGGGGVNVARAAHRLGGETKAVYTAGGPMGERLGELLEEEGVDCEAVAIDGQTRINPNVFEHSSEHLYRIILPGPELDGDDVARCRERLSEAMAGARYLVISGSLPRGLPDETYAELIASMQAEGKRVLLDCSGASLQRAVERGVHLIKPNHRELAELSGQELDSDEDVAGAAQRLIDEQSVERVMVSLGGGGAMLVEAGEVHRITAPTVTVRSQIGAGDSLMAGLALGLARGWDAAEAARFGVAAGAAAVMTPGTELCRKEDVERLYASMSGEARESARQE